MKVIKHGKFFKTAKLQKECSHCNCVFEFESEEIKLRATSFIEGIGFFGKELYIKCPECRNTIILKENEDYVVIED